MKEFNYKQKKVWLIPNTERERVSHLHRMGLYQTAKLTCYKLIDVWVLEDEFKS